MNGGVNFVPYRSSTRTKKPNISNLKQKINHPGEGKEKNYSNALCTLVNDECTDLSGEKKTVNCRVRSKEIPPQLDKRHNISTENPNTAAYRTSIR